MLQKVYNWLQEKPDNRNMRTLFFTCAAMLFFSSHAYGLLNPILAHDSLSEINLFGIVDFAGMDDYILKIRAGRFTEVMYQCLLRGKLALPWLTGLLSFCWLALTTLIVVRLFHMERRIQILLLCGLFMTNITVTSTIATYIHDADTNFLGLLLAALSVYYWRRGKKEYLRGIPCIVFCLGCYQSYLSVAIVLTMILSILDLMKGQTANTVFLNGLKAVLMIVIGGIIYLLLVIVTTQFCQTEIGGNLGTFGLSKMPLLKRLYMTYYRCVSTAFGPVSLMNHSLLKAISILALLLGYFPIFRFFLNREFSASAKLLVLVLLALLPLGMNITYMLCPGGVTELSSYAYWFFYLLVIALLPWYDSGKGRTKKLSSGRNLITTALLAGLILGNIQTANAAYLLREFWYSATLSMMTRVEDKMEETEGYESGVTPVCIIGPPQLEVPPGFERIADMTGLNMGGAMSAEERSHYFSYYLARPINAVNEQIRARINNKSEIENMPIFPEEGSICMEDGVLVIKLNNEDKMY